MATSPSITSDYVRDTAYETSDVGTPRIGNEYYSEIGSEDLTLDEGLRSPTKNLVKCEMSNIDEGLLMGQTILEQLEGFPKIRPHAWHADSKRMEKGVASNTSILVGSGTELSSEPDNCDIHISHWKWS